MSKKHAFTLVELIVVIVILAILATIAFLSFSSQSSSARDSTRLADMSNIAKGLSVFSSTAGKLPMPDSKIDIAASGNIIGYQGYAGASVLGMIKLSDGGKDPLDKDTYYTYSTNSNRTRYQILGFLEDRSNQALSLSPDFIRNSPKETSADQSSYSGRYSITKGDSLGILLDSNTMVPVQSANVNIDIITTNSGSSYRIVFAKDTAEVLTGTGIFSNMLLRSPELMRNKDIASMDSSLVAYWDMETLVASGTLMVLKDLSMYGNNGICYNSGTQVSCNSTGQGPKITIGNGITGKMMTFDGVDDWIRVINPQSVNFDYNDDHTVYIKMKIAKDQLDTDYLYNYSCILERWGSGGYPFAVRLNNQNHTNPNKVYYARYDTVNLPIVYDTVAYDESSYDDYVFIKNNSDINLFKNGIYGSGITDASISTTKNNGDFII